MIGFLKRRNDWPEQQAEEPPLMEIHEEMPARIEKSISSLNGHIERLNNKYREMLARSREYFEKCVDAIQSKDDEKAKIYASEIAEIKKLAGIVLHSQLVLLQVKIRLESILELGEALSLIRPLSAMLQNTLAEIADVSPEASEHLRNLMVLIEDFMTSSGVYVEPVSDSNTNVSQEVSFILDEARRIAAEKVRQSFPEAPRLTDLEKTVYSYVVGREDEELDLHVLAAELKIDPQTASEVLKNLHDKGLIQLEVAEAS
ncbi:MAG: hypothetical protein QXX19_00780 [Candidatus Caldarchaeum sp.]